MPSFVLFDFYVQDIDIWAIFVNVEWPYMLCSIDTLGVKRISQFFILLLMRINFSW